MFITYLYTLPINNWEHTIDCGSGNNSLGYILQYPTIKRQKIKLGTQLDQLQKLEQKIDVLFHLPANAIRIS